MPKFWTIAVTAVLVAVSTALPPPHRPCASRYPRAKHIAPLYRTTVPGLGNFEADIKVGSQTVRAIMDTGSSEIWFMPDNVECLDPETLQPIASDLCGYKGPRLTPSSSFELIPDTHTNLSYASGEGVVAINGYEKVSMAGINVPKQEINLAKTASVTYGGKASGLVGLAYPSLTKSYPGNNASKDVQCPLTIGADKSDCNQQHYSPLFSTIFTDGLTRPVFSFALSRSAPHAGVMAIGGIPDLHDPKVNITKKSVEVTVPIEKYENISDYAWYVTSVDGFSYTGAPAAAGKGQYVVDTGTVPVIIDKENADRFNALFDPPGWYNETIGGYFVQCNATAPELGVSIAGVSFQTNAKDLILSVGADDVGCFSGVQGSTTAAGFPPILGSVWLRSVLAVFDVGKTEMTFVSRPYYQE